MVFHPFYISFSATLSRTSFDTVRNDLDLQVCDKSGPGSSYSRHRRECSKRRGVEPRGGRGKEGRRLERNSSHRFHASPRFMKRDNRNTGWDTLWIRWNRIVSSPWTKLSSSTVEAASIYIHTHSYESSTTFFSTTRCSGGLKGLRRERTSPFFFWPAVSWRFSRTTRVCLPPPPRGGDCWLVRSSYFFFAAIG